MFHFTNRHQNILVRAGCEADVACCNPRPETQRKTREKSMNPANLPFDSEAMLQGLRGWVECESPTWEKGAVERMLDIAARDMAIMGATIERIAGRLTPTMLDEVLARARERAGVSPTDT